MDLGLCVVFVPVVYEVCCGCLGLVYELFRLSLGPHLLWRGIFIFLVRVRSYSMEREIESLFSLFVPWSLVWVRVAVALKFVPELVCHVANKGRSKDKVKSGATPLLEGFHS